MKEKQKNKRAPRPPHDSDMLLLAKDKDLHDMLGMAHPLHRRRVCLGIQKIKDKEEEEVTYDTYNVPSLGLLYYRPLHVSFFG